MKEEFSESLFDRVQRIYKDSYWELQDYENIEEIKFNTFKFEKKLIEIVHPFDDEMGDSEKMIEVTYEGETMDGVPHGLGCVEYKHK